MEHPTNDEQMIAIGGLVQNAAIADAILFGAFRILSKLEQKPARAIFFAFDAQPPRRRMIERLVGEIGDNTDKTLVTAILRLAETVYNQRNELAHALLMRTAPHVDAPAMRFNPKHLDEGESTKPVTHGYLKDLRHKSSEAMNSALEKYSELCQKHGAPPQLSY